MTERELAIAIILERHPSLWSGVDTKDVILETPCWTGDLYIRCQSCWQDLARCILQGVPYKLVWSEVLSDERRVFRTVWCVDNAVKFMGHPFLSREPAFQTLGELRDRCRFHAIACALQWDSDRSKG